MEREMEELKKFNTKDLQDKINEGLSKKIKIGEKTTFSIIHNTIQKEMEYILKQYNELEDFEIHLWHITYNGLEVGRYNFEWKQRANASCINYNITITKIPTFEFTKQFCDEDSLYNFIIKLSLEKELENLKNTIEFKEELEKKVLEHEEIIKEKNKIIESLKNEIEK